MLMKPYPLICFFVASIMVFFSTLTHASIVVVGSKGTILTSADGTIWTQTNRLPDDPIRSVVRGNNQYVASGDAYAYISLDGMNWQYQRNMSSVSRFMSAVWSNNQYVVVNSDLAAISTSSNGIDWTLRYRGGNDRYNSIASGSDKYVAVGGTVSTNSCIGYVATSRDGLTWSPVNELFPCMSGVTWGGNQFVAVGQKGGYHNAYESGILTSPDGLLWTWQPIPDGVKLWLGSTAWGNGQYVAVGEDNVAYNFAGLIFTSPDGVHWTRQSIAAIKGLRKVAWVNNQFIAVGSAGTILTSPDGFQWTSQKSGTENMLFDIS